MTPYPRGPLTNLRTEASKRYRRPKCPRVARIVLESDARSLLALPLDSPAIQGQLRFTGRARIPRTLVFGRERADGSSGKSPSCPPSPHRPVWEPDSGTARDLVWHVGKNSPTRSPQSPSPGSPCRGIASPLGMGPDEHPGRGDDDPMPLADTKFTSALPAAKGRVTSVTFP